MFRALLAGIAVVILFLVGAGLALATQGDPPVPHVRLPDRGSTLQAQRNEAAAADYRAGRLEAAVRYVLAVQDAQARAQAAAEAERLRQEAEPAAAFPATPTQSAGSASSWDGTGTPCAIPQYICDRESGGDPTIYNQSGSGASGKYQAMPGTWGGYGGYANAADAPESVQDEWAAELWDNGAGCAHWSAC